MKWKHSSRSEAGNISTADFKLVRNFKLYYGKTQFNFDPSSQLKQAQQVHFKLGVASSDCTAI